MISINLYEIVWQIINFTILVILLNKFLFRPLGTYIEKRTETIRQDLDQAQQGKLEADKLLLEQKETTKQAYVDATSIRHTAENTAKKEYDSILRKAEEDKRKVLQHAQKEADIIYSKTKQSLLEEIGNLASNLTQKLIHKTVEPQDQEAIVKAFINSSKELSKVQ